MKIVLQAETPEETVALGNRAEMVFEDVRRYCLFGLRLEGGLVPQDFQHWSATHGWLVGQTYVWLRKFEEDLNNVAARAGEDVR